MLNNASIIPARNLQKSYKSIIESVKTNKQPVILTTNEKPQVAIVSLEDLDRLKAAKVSQAALDMLKIAAESKEELKSLPANLREQADEFLYGKHE